jgi:sn1-specific diacylglycerol lipase
LDHAWKSVVVSIRGTFSIEDCITDVLISPESLDKLGNDFGFNAIDEYCHGGVMACAQNVHRDLDRHGLLDKLLIGEGAKYDGYTLRIVGHSLGAASSTLLSYMLKQKFPTLRCINYSPPGCSLTWKMATQCKEWCTSCVLDSDLVPRLTVESIERLRDEILDLIGRIKVPKSVVAQRFTENTFRLCNDNYDIEGVYTDDMVDILFNPDEVPETEYQQQLRRFREIQIERRRHRGTTRSIQLYPPGRILHLVKTGEKRSCTAGLAKVITCCTTNIGSSYVPIWVDNDDLNEIVVGPRMGTDHFPNRIRSILDEIAADVGICQ